MKPTTKEWLKAAKDDLDAAQTLVLKQNLTNLAAFHCQQCIEKCFKAILEEKNIQFKKSHDLLRLQSLINLNFNDSDNYLLQIINEVYIDSRYPGDQGLLPHGKPTQEETNSFINLSLKIYRQVNK